MFVSLHKNYSQPKDDKNKILKIAQVYTYCLCALYSTKLLRNVLQTLFGFYEQTNIDHDGPKFPHLKRFPI